MKLYFSVKRSFVALYVLIRALLKLKQAKYIGTVRPDTLFFRKYYYKFIRKFFLKNEQRERRSLEPSISKQNVKIPEDKGFVITKINSSVLKDAIQYSLNALETENLQSDSLYQNIRIVPSEKKHLPILRLAVSDEIIEPIKNYLGDIPVFFQGNILKSFNKVKLANSAQAVHLDKDDYRIVKVFIPLGNIDKDSGPLNFFSSSISKNICKMLFDNGTISQTGSRFSDSAIPTELWKTSKSFLGKPGDVAFVDTSNCFHFGSRVASKERVLLLLEYSSPYNQNLPLWNREYLDFEDCGFTNKKTAKFVFGLSHMYK